MHVKRVRTPDRMASRRALAPTPRIVVLALTAGIAGIVAAIHWGETTLAVGGGVLALAVTLAQLIVEQNARLRGLAATDGLTGLLNHRGFHESLAAELRRARRGRTELALVSIDLDDFKAINDTQGHPYGDKVLSAAGGKLSSVIRSGDIAARVGGEEFALLLPGAGADAAQLVAERARAAIGTISVHGNQLSSSAGIAIYPVDADDPPTLCDLADAALYSAKRAGKGRTRRFDADRVPIPWSEKQVAAIEELLRAPEPVRPVFQPVVALATGRAVGYEALARFPSFPQRTPDAFFAQAHACGLGAKLEAAAIRAALEPLGRPVGTHLALNVSPSALSSAEVQAALPADLHDIVIEITEHEFVPDDASLTASVADLRSRGAKIAIDDAGAGYAGLKQVMRVRPDIVKLDRDLTHEIHADPARMALVESFVRFARQVGATVCAEGIETLDDVAALANLDVEWGQGYVLARPEDPWTSVSPVAAQVCRAALTEALHATAGDDAAGAGGDRGLVRATARLAGARTNGDLESALGAIVGELHADSVCISRWHPDREVIETLAESSEGSGEVVFPVGDYPMTERVLREREAVQLLIGDPATDPAEVQLLLTLGHRSMLMVPVVCRGLSLGIVELFRDTERPWTRAEINSARVIANQIGSVLEAFFPAGLSHSG